jgi:4-carboxymuconolactone decarboxylase
MTAANTGTELRALHWRRLPAGIRKAEHSVTRRVSPAPNKPVNDAPLRFPPIADADLTPAQRAIVEEIAAGPRGGVRGPFVALLHQPPLAKHLQALGEHLRFGTKLSNDLIEIAVLVTAQRWRCRHEWIPHARLARIAGVDEAIIAAIDADLPPPGLTPAQTVVLRFAKETHDEGAPCDATFEAALALFGRDGVLDLLVLCGYYATLAMVLNTAKGPLPPDAAPPLRTLANKETK